MKHFDQLLRRLVAEGLGTALLLAIVVGSAVMGVGVGAAVGRTFAACRRRDVVVVDRHVTHLLD